MLCYNVMCLRSIGFCFGYQKPVALRYWYGVWRCERASRR